MTVCKRPTSLAGCVAFGYAILSPSLEAARAADLTEAAPPTPVAAPPPTFPHWYLRLGVLGEINEVSSKLYAQPLATTIVPGIGPVTLGVGPQQLLAGRNSVSSNLLTAGVQFGYFVTTNWSLEIAGGVPVWESVRITGSGSGPPAGTVLATVLPGAPVLTAVYHLTQFNAFQPYAGAGIVGGFAFTVRNGFNTGASIIPSLGVVLQGGFDYMFDQNWGVFFDAKKLFIHSDGRATGVNLGPPAGIVPAAASISSDSRSWVLTAGVTYRF